MIEASASLRHKVLDLAVALQHIPSPTFAERARAEYVFSLLSREDVCDAEIDAVGNVYARLPGRRRGRPLVVSAHTDTVFPAATVLTGKREAQKIYGPGIGDNSLGVAGLFGLLWSIREQKLDFPGDIWLVANVAEEGLGDLKGMRAVVDRFGGDVRTYLILEGMALGQIYHRALGVQRFRITSRTTGGHSWVDFGRPSAIHELAALITRLSALPLSRNPRTTLNVGMISGGTSINTIAPQAMLELDLRSESERALKNLVGKVLDLVAAANRPNMSITAELIGQRPAGKISADHPLVKLARACLEEQGIQPNLSIGSTDANIPLSCGLPAICIGLTTGQGAHTVHEFINTVPLSQGLGQLTRLVQRIFESL